jgi:hypothetical protein
MSDLVALVARRADGIIGMVVCAVGYEPVSEAKNPDNREKYREKTQKSAK